MNRVLAVLMSAAVLCFVAALTVFALEVVVRPSGQVILTATPQAIGTAPGRYELEFRNNATSSGAAICSEDEATVSRTPGATSGAAYGPGEGFIRCVSAERPFYCISADAAATVVVSYDEARMVTATPTATPTRTPTPV